MPHQAFLFTGTRGVGKTSLARILTKALNCEHLKNGEPCNKCDSCLSINDGSSIDFQEIEDAFHPIMEILDHTYLNDIEDLNNPTSENICIWIWKKLKPSLPEILATAPEGAKFPYKILK